MAPRAGIDERPGLDVRDETDAGLATTDDVVAAGEVATDTASMDTVSPSDGATSGGATSDGATSDGATSDGDTSDGDTSDGATVDPAATVAVDTPAAEAVEAKAVEAKDAEAKAVEAKAVEAKDAEAKDAEAKAVEAKDAAGNDTDAVTDGDTSDGATVDSAATVAVDTPAAVRPRGLHRPTTRGGWIAAAVFVLVVALGIGALVWLRAGTLPEGVALAVNDTEVTVDQLDKQAETMRALYGVQPPQDEAGRDRFRRDLAQSTAVGLVIDQVAAERGVAVSEKIVQDTMGRYVEQFFGAGPDARRQFVAVLGNAGVTEADVIGELKRQLLVRDLFGQVTKDVTVGADEVKATFEQRRDELGLPERRRLQNIVVGTQGEAQTVAAELTGGADFAAVAQARSADQSTKDKGGDLGLLARRQLEQGYAAAAFGAAPGAVFGPVQTRFGWNVGKVTSVTPAEPTTYEAIQARLTDAVKLEKAMGVWREFLRSQIADADVRYADDFLPANPEALPGLDTPSNPAGSGEPAAPAPPR